MPEEFKLQQWPLSPSRQEETGGVVLWDIAARSFLTEKGLTVFASPVSGYVGNTPLFREVRKLAWLSENLCEECPALSSPRVYLQAQSQVRRGRVVVRFTPLVGFALGDSWRILPAVVSDHLSQQRGLSGEQLESLVREYGVPAPKSPDLPLWLSAQTLGGLNDLRGELAFLQAVRQVAEFRFAVQARHAGARFTLNVVTFMAGMLLTVWLALLTLGELTSRRIDLDLVYTGMFFLFVSLTVAVSLYALLSIGVRKLVDILSALKLLRTGSRWQDEQVVIHAVHPLSLRRWSSRAATERPEGDAEGLFRASTRQQTTSSMTSDLDPRREWLRGSLAQAVQEARDLLAQTGQLPESAEQHTLLERLRGVIEQGEMQLERGVMQEQQEQLRTLQRQTEVWKRKGYFAATFVNHFHKRVVNRGA